MQSKESIMETVTVYGYRDPDRFAGFPDFDTFVQYLESSYGSNENHDSMNPLEDPAYIIDPALATLIASPEFQKLNTAVKTEILKDQNLMEAFAKFINSNGTFVLNNSTESATWQVGPPPIITLPNSFLNPTQYYVDRTVFALAHEIYHNEFQTLPPYGQPLTALQWAHNEAVATLAAYRATERMNLYLTGNGFGAKQGSAIGIIRNSTNDADAIQGLEDFYITVALPSL